MKKENCRNRGSNNHELKRENRTVGKNTGSGRLSGNAKGQHTDTERIGYTIEYLSGVAAKVSDGGGGGSASEEGFYPLPILAEAGGRGGVFRRRRIAGRYVPEI